MTVRRRNFSFSSQCSAGFASIHKLVVLVIFATVAMGAIPSLLKHRQSERLAEGVSALARYSLDMERFYLEHGRYGEPRAGCGVHPPATTRFLSFSCRTNGDSYIAAVRGIGALSGYEYVIDDSAQPRRTVRFEGVAVHTQCWMRTSSSCYS